MLAGYLGAAALWYACVAWIPLEAFRRLPDPVAVVTEWLSPRPTYGISIFTEAYSKHILYSTWPGGEPQGNPARRRAAGRAAEHLHRPADRDGRGVVLARRGRDDRRAVRPGLPHHGVLQPDPVSDHRHRHGDARAARLPEQRPDPGAGQPPHALARAEPRLRRMSGALSIRGVGKTYDPEGASVQALRDCSFEVHDEEFVAIVGPSGCGKSTLLNAIAGFDTVTAGQFHLDC